MKFLFAVLATLGLMFPLPSTTSFASGPVHAQVVPAEPVTVRLAASTTGVEPGGTVRIGVEFVLAPGWHIYFRDPGDTGKATGVQLELPQGASAGPLLWEKPRRFSDAGFNTFGYEGRTVIACDVQVPASAKPGDKLLLKAHVDWLACHDTCQPGSQDLEIEVTVVAPGTVRASPDAGIFSGVGFTGATAEIPLPETPATGSGGFSNKLQPREEGQPDYGLLGFVVFAFIGGVLLNLMPCVLPVVSLKVIRFVKEAGEDKRHIFRLGLAYAAGTMATCWALALVVVVAKAMGYSLGWGFQFQSPLFLLGLATIVVVLALSLFGVFYVQVGAGGLDRLSYKGGFVGAFFTGVVATVLSTPCTAPFLGTAIGFAFSQPAYVTMLIFTSVGAGLAAPYVLLTWQPGWMKYIPKPGVWMERFKESMGFVMLGSAVWLLYVIGRQTSAEAVVACLAFLVFAACATWAISWLNAEAGSLRKSVVWVAVVLLGMFLGWWLVLPALAEAEQARMPPVTTTNGASAIDWKPFDAKAIEQHLASGKIVLVDFTADWCLTCKVNERVALSGTRLPDALKRLGVVAMKADWTRGDPAVTTALKQLGRSGVPLYVIFSPHDPQRPIILPELISEDLLLQRLEDASRAPIKATP